MASEKMVQAAYLLNLRRVKLSDGTMAGASVHALTGTPLTIETRAKRGGVIRLLVRAEIDGAPAWGWVSRTSVVRLQREATKTRAVAPPAK